MKKKFVNHLSIWIDGSLNLKRMKLTILFSFLVFTLSWGSSLSQTTKVSLDLKDLSLKEVIDEIEKQTDFYFLYQDDVFDKDLRISIRARKESLDSVLKQIEKLASVKAEITDSQIVLKKQPVNSKVETPRKSQKGQQEKVEISGSILDVDGRPIPGATIVVKDAAIGTVADIDGNFRLKIPADAQVLQFSFVGMLIQEIPISGQTIFNIVLEEATVGMDEVVVVGYGIQKRESVVGSIVQTTSEDIVRTGGVTTVGQAITGKLPGVVAISTTGLPGEEAPNIYIRGRSTWNGSGQPLILVDGIERSMTDIDINEIERISVLKDASATAVFGVKGANGVILITTKSGKKGKAQLSVSANSTLKLVSKLPEKLDAFSSLQIVNEAIEREVSAKEQSWSDYTPMEELYKYKNPANQYELERYPNVDWRNELFKDYALDHRVNITARGGSDFVTYFGSLSYQHVGDIFDTDKYDNNRGYSPSYAYDRFNYRSNLDFDISKSTKLSVKLSGYYGIQQTTDGTLYLILSSIYKMAPSLYYPMHSDGTYGRTASDIWELRNPLVELTVKGAKQNHRVQLNNDFILDQKLDFITKGLSFKGTLSYDNFMVGRSGVAEVDPVGINNVVYKRYLDNGDELLITPDGKNSFDFVQIPWSYNAPDYNFSGNNNPIRRFFYQLMLNYSRTFADKHDVNALFLMSREEYAAGSMFPRFREDWVARVTYNYASRYFLDVNGAYNGSEMFGPGYRFELFPSVAIGWMISNESFLKSADWLDKLKVRASYGLVGDDNVSGRWGYISQWASGGSAYMNYTNPWGGRSPYTYYKEAVVGNPDLHWETSTKSNFGLEASILKNMVSLNLDVFDETRDDIILSASSRSLPDFIGSKPASVNAGKVNVKGYEFTLGFNHSFASKVNLNSSFSFAHAEDKILLRDEPELKDDHLKEEGYAIGLNKIPINGEMMTSWDDVYMSVPLSSDGNYRRPGYYDYMDFNADGKYESQADVAPYGYPVQPRNTWSWTTSVEYKGWSAMVQFYGAYNAIKRYSSRNFDDYTPVFFDQYTDYWTVDNPSGGEVLPSWRSGADTDGGVEYFDSSFIRLKNAEVAYSIPKEMCQKLGVSSLKLFVNGNNLFFWSKLPDDREMNRDDERNNPSYNGDYPTFKRINLGFNINF